MKEQLKQSKLLEAQRKKQSLPSEPAQGDPNACDIVIRLPVTGNRISRRFLKSDKIQTLYHYIDSLGDEVQFENHTGEYVIMQSIPRKVFADREKSLQEEGLFPRAMLQIKEE
jgi:FAS-associated factor 2